MEEKIKAILRHQYPDKYEELHEQTAELICALLRVVWQSEQLKCDNCKCTPTVIHNTPSGRFCEACRPVTL